MIYINFKNIDVMGVADTGGSSGGTTIDVAQDRIKLTKSEFETVPSYFDFSNCTDVTSMFENCSNLHTISLILDKCANADKLCYNCTSLDNAEINLPNAINVEYLFSDCRLLRTANVYVAAATNVANLFGSCSNLETVNDLDLTSATSANNLFYMSQENTKLKKVILNNTANITRFNLAFRNCVGLEELNEINATSMTSIINPFYNCTSLTSFGGFKDLKISLNISHATALTADSLMNVINQAKDLSIESKTATLTLGTTNISKLTEEQIAIATAKGWTLA